MIWRALMPIALACGIGAAGDLKSVRAEPNLEKRYVRALDNAGVAINEARKHLNEDNTAEFRKSLDEVVESFQVCDDTLRATGKDPSRQSKHFKRAELRMRDLLRRLDGLNQDAGFEDRPLVDSAKKRILELHEELLLDIMGRRKS